MLNCWEVDAKRRLHFREIVTELSKLMGFHDDGYYVLDCKKATSLDDPTMPPNADDGYVIPIPDANT